MRLKVYKFESEHYKCLQPCGNDAWVALDDWNKLLEDYPLYKNCSKPVFVKIEPCDPMDISEFVIYKRLHRSNTNEWKGYIRFPEKLRSEGDLTTSLQSMVQISVVDENAILIADYVNVKVDEKEVDRWNKSDIEEATNKLREQSLYCMEQKVFVNRDVFDFTVGYFKEVEPKPESQKTPFWITPKTEICFEGMPAPNDFIDFDKIGGQKEVVNELRQIIQLPMNFPDYFTKFDTNPPKGILLYGPPGNGKTMIAKAVAQSLGASFIEIDLTDALQKYKGVGEYNLGKKFEEAERKKNAVIFIDEIDSIASVRT